MNDVKPKACPPIRCRLLNFIWKVRNNTLRRSLITLVVLTYFILVAVVSFYLFVFFVPWAQDMFVGKATQPKNLVELSSNPNYIKSLVRHQKDLETITKKYDALTPQQTYLVVNTTDNEFYLYRGGELIREGFCSSGSYIKLKAQDDREWLFRTPKGRFRIQGKITSPVWRKPDWAFVEEGLPVPSADHPSRYEKGVLGDYALSLGGGYLIHGTLYKRQLGMPVTHGCIRLNDEDLEQIYNSLNIGSRVYIY